MRKADYDSIALVYDRGRDIGGDNIRLWLDLVAAQHPAGRKKQTAADLGCGTGRFALPLAYGYGYRVIGVDRSAGMLAQARKKDRDRKIRWLKADVESDCFEPESLDVIFMSHLLHHLASPLEFLKRCYGYLKPGGSLFVRYGAREDIRGDVVHRFFPRTVALDRERTLSAAGVRGLLRAAGLAGIKTVKRDQRTYAAVEKRRASLVFKGTSVQTFLTEREHRAGLKRFDAYAARHPDDPWLLSDRLCLSWGRKP